MSYNKVTIVVLGNQEALKKALITNILGKDLSLLPERKLWKNTEIYENYTYKVTFTPDLYIPCDDIQLLFSKNPKPDLCLVVVEDGFSPEDVWKDIQDLSKKTRKSTNEFKVILPLGNELKDYPFQSCTIQQVFTKLDQLANERQHVTNKKRFHYESQHMSRPHGVMETGGRCSQEPYNNPITSLKRKHTGTKVNLVLLGMAGTGKSASGNTIIGKKCFMSKPSSKPVTTECQTEDTEIKGVHVRVIDTPDIFDDDIKPSVRDKHVRRCKELFESGHCVFVLVMHVSRFTDGERHILKKLEKCFGSKVREQTVILFTRGDDLYCEGINLEGFLHSCQPDLMKIVEMCGNRCVLFENCRSCSDQVGKLIDEVMRMLEE